MFRLVCRIAGILKVWITEFGYDLSLQENFSKFVMSIISAQPTEIKTHSVMQVLVDIIITMVFYNIS
jgi:hypothetical protein